MDCPLCKEAMIVLELDEVETDYCESCGGIWLDAEELELLLQDARERDALLSSFAAVEVAEEKDRDCPICSMKMEKVSCGSSGKVLIDRCVKRHGLWFDRGELQGVISMGSLDKESRVINLLKDMFRITT